MKDKRKNMVKTYLNDDEYKSFINDLNLYEMSQAEMIRWALFNKRVTFRTIENPYNNDIKKYLMNLGMIGNNINQIAKYLNETGTLNESLVKDIKNLVNETRYTNIKLSNLFEKYLVPTENEYTIYLREGNEHNGNS